MVNLRESFERLTGRRPSKTPPSDGHRKPVTTLKIKGYTETKKLGKGSFGQATLVIREETKEKYCAKFVRYRHMSSAEKEYVVREVNTMAHLSSEGGHPYIVRFRESFTLASGPLVIIMELCDGGDLGQVIKSAARKRTPFAESQIHLWLLQILSATDYLHTRKVLHRDIKPGNVFMHAGACKLGDLGLSKQTMLTATMPGKHTQCGSPLYLAPEVHMGQKYGKMVDIWAVGCVLFELMMHDHAFQGPDNPRILQNIVWAKHAPIDKCWSAGLIAILEGMLELRPEDRPEAADIILDPVVAPVLQSGQLHAKALRHQHELAHLAESPTSVDQMQLEMAQPQGSARPSSAPPSVAKYPPGRAASKKEESKKIVAEAVKTAAMMQVEPTREQIMEEAAKKLKKEEAKPKQQGLGNGLGFIFNPPPAPWKK